MISPQAKEKNQEKDKTEQKQLAESTVEKRKEYGQKEKRSYLVKNPWMTMKSWKRVEEKEEQSRGQVIRCVVEAALQPKRKEIARKFVFISFLSADAPFASKHLAFWLWRICGSSAA